MHVLTPPVRLIALLLAMVLAASACSSGSDDAAAADADADTTVAADTGSSDAGSSDTEPAPSDAAVSCDVAGEAAALLRGANGWVPQVVDAESNDLIGSTDSGASVLAAIETLRPIQDIEGPLGSMREGLDNMEADIIAINEGRFDDKVGGYSIAAMNGVIGEEIC